MTLFNKEYFTWNLDRLLKLKVFLSENDYGNEFKKEELQKIVHQGLQMKSKFGQETYISLKNYIGDNIQEFLSKPTALQNAPLAMAIFNLKIQQSIHPPLFNTSMEKAAKLYKILYAVEEVDVNVTRIIRNITYYKSYKDGLKITDKHTINENLVINYLKEVILQKIQHQHQILLNHNMSLEKNQSSFEMLDTDELKILKHDNRAPNNKAMIKDCYVKLVDVFQCKFKSRLESRIVANYKKKQLRFIQLEKESNISRQTTIRKKKNNNRMILMKAKNSNDKRSKSGRMIKQIIKLNL